MTNFYVYYRVEERNVDAVALSVESLFKTVKEKTRIQGKWLRRRDDPSTYMEVYEGVKDGEHVRDVTTDVELACLRKTQTQPSSHACAPSHSAFES